MMQTRNKKFLKNTGILGISQFSSKLLSFFFVPIYTRYLTTLEYGKFDIIMSSVSILIPILTLNINDAMMTYTLDDLHDKNNVSFIGLKYNLISLPIFIIVVLIIRLFNFVPTFNGIFVYLIIYYILSLFSQFCSLYAKGNDRVSLIGIIGIISTIVTIIFNITFIVYLKIGFFGLILTNIFSLATQIFIYTIVLNPFKVIKFNHYNRTLENSMIKYSIPLIFTSICWWVNSVSDKYAAALMCGLAADGLLAMSYKIPNILNIVQNILIQSWQITGIQEYKSDDSKEFYGITFYRINTIAAFVCMTLLLFLKPISKILFLNEFSTAWLYVPFLLFSCVINTASGYLGPIIAARKDSKVFAISSIVSAITNLVLNVVFIKLIGLQGACIATAISSLIIYVIRKLYLRNVISSKYIFYIYLSWILILIMCIINIFYFNYLLLLVLFLVFIILYLKLITDLTFKLFSAIINKMHKIL